MSYINFSLKHLRADPAATVDTLSAGFGREGGRLELVETSTSSRGVRPPHDVAHELTPEVRQAAGGVLAALQAAQWVQDIVVAEGTGAQPAHVSWTLRSGQAANAVAGALPERVQSVLDAAAALQALLPAR